ncbi:adenylate/guanylate cyclase domain-containing protein [Bradyrhizobium sp.]|uniref:adenylate/guanylate cyclase domain-containing protein n=1 Tax=Bradyrhizobium sp. TaxID=376 RepID=UPI00403837D3
MVGQAASSSEQIRELARGIGLRQVRLVSGSILFTYLVSHFLNHGLGNISLEAMADGVRWHTAFWQFLPVSIVFYTACIVHTGLGLWALYERRQFRWKTLELLQLALGLSIPVLVITHVLGVRLAYTLNGRELLYPQVLFSYFVAFPAWRIWSLVAAILAAWTHGCIGLHMWLRMKPFYKRAAPLLFAAAVLLPAFAMLGIYQGGRIVVDNDGIEWRAENLSPDKIGTRQEKETSDRAVDYSLMLYLGLIALALLARGARALHERRGGMINLSYGNGRTVRVPKGLTVLEASLRNSVPHASVCGGRARCSTCRIRIIGDCSALPAPSQREAFVLHRVGTDDPSIRLACQLKPTADLSFFQLFLPHTVSADGHAGSPARIGQERYLVSMFVDMRGSTKMAEKRLPFDTVFIVNRFLGAVSAAVLDAGGRPNQFVGDGMLALFGLSVSRRQACRQALRAAAMIAANVEELNKFLSHDLHEPIRFGIGIHGGEVIVGDIGYRDHMVFTALGDPVNVAARLQDMTKALACEVVISDEVRETAGLEADTLPEQEAAIRGRNEPMIVRSITDARTLATLVVDVDVAAA